MPKKAADKPVPTSKRTKGTVVVFVEVAEEVGAELEKFMRERGETKKRVVEDALRRHLKHPPDREPPFPAGE